MMTMVIDREAAAAGQGPGSTTATKQASSRRSSACAAMGNKLKQMEPGSSQAVLPVALLAPFLKVRAVLPVEIFKVQAVLPMVLLAPPIKVELLVAWVALLVLGLALLTLAVDLPAVEVALLVKGLGPGALFINERLNLGTDMSETPSPKRAPSILRQLGEKESFPILNQVRTTMSSDEAHYTGLHSSFHLRSTIFR